MGSREIRVFGSLSFSTMPAISASVQWRDPKEKGTWNRERGLWGGYLAHTGEICRRHSRFYARARGLMVSKLGAADKLAFVLTPAWLYLPLARASGELWEYMERSRNRQMGDEHFTDVEWAEVTSTDPPQWLRGLQS